MLFLSICIDQVITKKVPKIPKNSAINLLIFPNILNPVYEMQTTVNGIRAVFINCTPNLVNELTSHEKVVNIFNMIMAEMTIPVNTLLYVSFCVLKLTRKCIVGLQCD